MEEMADPQETMRLATNISGKLQRSPLSQHPTIISLPFPGDGRGENSLAAILQ
jgi:hypothetical protein